MEEADGAKLHNRDSAMEPSQEETSLKTAIDLACV